MVNRNVVAAKLAELALRVARVRKHSRPSSAELAADSDALDLLAFNLMLSVQLCADIASHIIADAGWPSARSLALLLPMIRRMIAQDRAVLRFCGHRRWGLSPSR